MSHPPAVHAAGQASTDQDEAQCAFPLGPRNRAACWQSLAICADGAPRHRGTIASRRADSPIRWASPTTLMHPLGAASRQDGGRPMDLINGLQTFIRVVETGSFSAVAREANTSQSAVTRQVAQLGDAFRRSPAAPDNSQAQPDRRRPGPAAFAHDICWKKQPICRRRLDGIATRRRRRASWPAGWRSDPVDARTDRTVASPSRA